MIIKDAGLEVDCNRKQTCLAYVNGSLIRSKRNPHICHKWPCDCGEDCRASVNCSLSCVEWITAYLNQTRSRENEDTWWNNREKSARVCAIRHAHPGKWIYNIEIKHANGLA